MMSVLLFCKSKSLLNATTISLVHAAIHLPACSRASTTCHMPGIVSGTGCRSMWVMEGQPHASAKRLNSQRQQPWYLTQGAPCPERPGDPQPAHVTLAGTRARGVSLPLYRGFRRLNWQPSWTWLASGNCGDGRSSKSSVSGAICPAALPAGPPIKTTAWKCV